jgi:hypothetical protein
MNGMNHSCLPRASLSSGLSLLNRFTLLSALILLIGALLIGWWVDRRIYQVVTEDSIELATVFVDSTIAPHLTELPSVNALTLSQASHLKQLIANNVATGRYAAVNLWSPDGELVFSTLPAQAARPQSAEGLRAALAGQVFTHATDSIRSDPSPATPGPFLESYFPVRAGDGTTLAVIDLYQNLAALERSTLQVRLQSWLVVGTATALMFFLLYGSCAKVAKRSNHSKRPWLSRGGRFSRRRCGRRRSTRPPCAGLAQTCTMARPRIWGLR